MLLLLSSRFLLFLEHLADAAQIVRGRDAEGKLEGTDVCCGILETALAGNVFCLLVQRQRLIADDGTVVVKCRKNAMELFVSPTEYPIITQNIASHHHQCYYDDDEYCDDMIGHS